MVCRKQQFDKKTALTILNERKSNRRKYAKECRIYECPICNKWHLTSMEEYDERIELKEEDLIFCSLWKRLRGDV